MPKSIACRIKFEFIDRDEIYIQDIDELRKGDFNSYNIAGLSYHPIEIGTQFTINCEKVEVTKIYTEFMNQEINYEGKGVNLYRIGEYFPWNFQIIYVLKRV